MREVEITKQYSDGRIITVKVRGNEDHELSVGESTNNSTAAFKMQMEKKHQDRKYYEAIQANADIDSIFESFNDLCKTMEWD